MGEFSKQVIRDLMQQKAERNLRLELLAQQRKNELEQMQEQDRLSRGLDDYKNRAFFQQGQAPDTGDPELNKYTAGASQNQLPAMFATQAGMVKQEKGLTAKQEEVVKKKELTQQQVNALTSGNAAIKNIEFLLEATNQSKGKFMAGVGMPFGFGATEINQALEEISTDHVYTKSGANINEREFKRLKGLLPTRVTLAEAIAKGSLEPIRKNLRKFEAKVRMINKATMQGREAFDEEGNIKDWLFVGDKEEEPLKETPQKSKLESFTPRGKKPVEQMTREEIMAELQGQP